MDVLNFYMPDIDWTLFDRGDVSTEIWGKFKEVILLCHAAVHWERELKALRGSRPQALPTGTLNGSNGHMLGQSVHSAIHQIEMHMRRANFLATEKILEMGKDVPKKYDGSAGAKLFVALRASVGIQADDCSAQCISVCFTEFDAQQELAGEPVAIVRRWQEREISEAPPLKG
ncbi:MAG: hypothetical protein IPK59_00690 [Rhodospirillaceae bacterium]|nr:hypothetical protein [Rhodospirillaceae bacterium]